MHVANLRRAVRCGVAFLALTVAIAGCRSGASEESTGDAQPAPDVSVFRDGFFDQIPRYPRSQELGSAVEEGDVVSQSFTVSNASPRRVLEYYASNLTGWDLVEPIHPLGPGDEAFRGAWEKDGRHLRVSASSAPTVEADDPERPMIQYNLQLGPASSGDTFSARR